MLLSRTPKRKPPFTGRQWRTSPRKAVASASSIRIRLPASTAFGDRMPRPFSELSTSWTVADTGTRSTSHDIFADRLNAHLVVRRRFLIAGLGDAGSGSSTDVLLSLPSVTWRDESVEEREESSSDSRNNSMKHPSQATILLFALGGQSRGSGVSRSQMTQVSTAIPPSYPQRHPLSPDTCREQAFR